MTEEQKEYYNVVVWHLINYKEYKMRLEAIEIEMEDLLSPHMGIDYSRDKIQVNRLSNTTMEISLSRLDSELAKEYRYKRKIVETIERGINSLTPIERNIIEHKYLTGRIEKDTDIFNRGDIPYQKTRYYHIKDEAIKKIYRVCQGVVM